MAANIEMNIKQENGQYEIVYPQTTCQNIIDINNKYYTKNQILNSTILSQFGLGVNSIPSQIFSKLGNSLTYKTTQIPKFTPIIISIASLNEGDYINLPENNQPVQYKLVKKNYENGLNTQGIALFQRQTSYYGITGWNTSGINTYANSTVDNYLNSTFLNLFPSGLSSKIINTSFYYTIGGGNTNISTLSRKIFLASAAENGWTAPSGSIGKYYNVEGSRLTNLMGGATRTPRIRSYDSVITDQYVGGNYEGYHSVTRFYGGNAGYDIYPCLCFSNTDTITLYQDSSTSKLYDSQQYNNLNVFSDYKNNLINIIQLHYGNYVGTGVYGQSNPNKIMCEFSPKLVLIGVGTPGEDVSVFVYGAQYQGSSIGSSSPNIITWGENFVEWYSNGNASSQLNANGIVYSYVIFY